MPTKKQVSARSTSRGQGQRPRAPRATREQTTERILDAAAELFAAKNPHDVTVREVAERAGVTHALVHQYVGTKDDLLSAVIQRVSRDRAAIVHDSPDLETAVDVIARQILANRLHSKSLVRSAMDDVEYVSLHERVRTGHALIELIARSRALGGAPAPPPADLDPRVIVGALAALLFGWAATEEWAWSMFGLDPSDKECVYGELLKIAHYIADLAYVTSNAQQGES